MKTRILLVDDHDIICKGLYSLISRCSNYQVVGQACNGVKAIEQTCLLKPHVVVMNVCMPRMNGIDATRIIKQKDSGVKVIMQSVQDREQYVNAAIMAGAGSYLLKTHLANELLPAIKAILRGDVFFSQDIACYVDSFRSRRQGQTQQCKPLSLRERQVLELLAEGKSSKEIALQIGVGKNTVVTHRQNIMNKLQLRSIAELTKYAILEGITSLDIQ